MALEFSKIDQINDVRSQTGEQFSSDPHEIWSKCCYTLLSLAHM